jgi:hypothetical protein
VDDIQEARRFNLPDKFLSRSLEQTSRGQDLERLIHGSTTTKIHLGTAGFTDVYVPNR